MGYSVRSSLAIALCITQLISSHSANANQDEDLFANPIETPGTLGDNELADKDDMSDPECDVKCGTILKGKYPDGTPVKKSSELFLKCLAYQQTIDAEKWDTALMFIDGATFSMCTAACFAPTSPAALWCDIAQTASGMAEMGNMIYMTVKFQHHMGVGEIMGLALGAAGIGMGLKGLGGRF